MTKRIFAAVCALCLLITATFTGCNRELTYKAKKTENGILITTRYCTLTLPEIWDDEYDVEFTGDAAGYSLRFIDRVSYKDQGFGGHVFTLTVAPAMGETLAGFNRVPNEVLRGTVITDQEEAFTVSTSGPTDVQYTEGRQEIYRQLLDTVEQIAGSLAAAETTTYLPINGDTFLDRAQAVSHQSTGIQVMNAFKKATGKQGRYVGIALDKLTLSDQQTDTVDYGFHVYETGNSTYYLIPFEEQQGTVAKVYEMTNYPEATLVWQQPDEKALYADFVKTASDVDGYALRDLDANGVLELILLHETAIRVYTVETEMTMVGEKDFFTGTFRLLTPVNEDYPGLFVFTVGGGYDHYQYLTLKNGSLTVEDLWEDSISGDFADNFITADSEKIRASQKAYQQNTDLVWQTPEK